MSGDGPVRVEPWWPGGHLEQIGCCQYRWIGCEHRWGHRRPGHNHRMQCGDRRCDAGVVCGASSDEVLHGRGRFGEPSGGEEEDGTLCVRLDLPVRRRRREVARRCRRGRSWAESACAVGCHHGGKGHRTYQNETDNGEWQQGGSAFSR